MHTACNVDVLVCSSAKAITYDVSRTVLGAANTGPNVQKQDGPQIRGASRLFAYKVTHTLSQYLSETSFGR